MIYVTAYSLEDIQNPGQSTDSGFDSLDAVLAALGLDYVFRTTRYVVYGDAERVVFSDFPFRLEPITDIDDGPNN